MQADFSGYATRAGVKCSDGRTIMPNAFAGNDGQKVPLVWQHGHNDPNNVLGHAKLENRQDGVYAYGFFNETPGASSARESVKHGDITSLSIYANQLQEDQSNVMHGVIREVSLVLSGANPEARIDNVYIKHSDGFQEEIDGEVVIYSGAELSHADESDKKTEDKKTEESEDRTVKDVLDTFNEEQTNVLNYLLEEVSKDSSDDSGDSDDSDDSDNSIEQSDLNNSDNLQGDTMNVFEKNGKKGSEDAQKVLTHSQVQEIIQDADKNTKSLKASILAHADKYGIENIDFLFPDAQALSNKPDLISRRMEWVSTVLSGTRKNPFTRIKSMSYDITHEDARAKGYITGNMKKDEYFGLARRETTPQTIYKRQKLDRDDIIDVTTLDVVAWLKAEMRIMLDEEIARAILFGDGREVDDEDKIREDKIRPIATDHSFYTHPIEIPAEDADNPDAITELIIRSHKHYRGSGNVTLFTSTDFLTDLLLQKDQLGRRLYRSEAELASEMRVSKIVTTELLDDLYRENTTIAGLKGIIVNLSDYSVGTDRGGQITMFDDFDIDFNQYKYLIEGRMSGALTKPKSAISLWAAGTAPTGGTAPEPQNHAQVFAPSANEATHWKQIRTDDDGFLVNESGEYVGKDGQPLGVDEDPITRFD